MPAYQPSEIPPPGAVPAGQDERAAAAELLTLTWEFLTSASPAVRGELQHFLTSRGCHPAAALGWFLDGLQFTGHSMSQPPPGGLPHNT